MRKHYGEQERHQRAVTVEKRKRVAGYLGLAALFIAAAAVVLYAIMAL